jgi:hypothetical protein
MQIGEIKINKISVWIDKVNTPSRSKVVGTIARRQDFADILLNAKEILENRLLVISWECVAEQSIHSLACTFQQLLAC